MCSTEIANVNKKRETGKFKVNGNHPIFRAPALWFLQWLKKRFECKISRTFNISFGIECIFIHFSFIQKKTLFACTVHVLLSQQIMQSNILRHKLFLLENVSSVFKQIYDFCHRFFPHSSETRIPFKGVSFRFLCRLTM